MDSDAFRKSNCNASASIREEETKRPCEVWSERLEKSAEQEHADTFGSHAILSIGASQRYLCTALKPSYTPGYNRKYVL
jgi:hypothetical protein